MYTTTFLVLFLSCTSVLLTRAAPTDLPPSDDSIGGNVVQSSTVVKVPNFEGVTSESLASATIKISIETGQAANALDNLIRYHYSGGIEPSPLSPCFIQEREENQEKTDILGRLVEDYYSALGYSTYIRQVKEHYSYVISNNPSCALCVFLDNGEKNANRLKDSLSNLILHKNASVILTTTVELPEGTADDSHCADLCYEQQARVYTRMSNFAYNYVPDDVHGLKEQ